MAAAAAAAPQWAAAEHVDPNPNKLWDVLGRGKDGKRGKRALLQSKDGPAAAAPLIDRRSSIIAAKAGIIAAHRSPASAATAAPREDDMSFIPLDDDAARGRHELHPDAGAVSRPIWARSSAYHETFHLALHQEILDFVRYVTPTEAERAVRAALLDRLQAIAAGVFPAAQLQVFGSYATDLYLPTSDIDVCVIGSGESQKDALRRLGSALRQHGFERVQCIDNAKVPIVKCVDAKSGISVDVSFDVSNGPANVGLIKEYLRRYPALRPLVLVLKCFLLQRKLNEVFSGGIGSYCLILVVMSHLQMYGSNFRRPADQKPSLGTLLTDLFHLYGKLFNYTNVGLAPRGRGSYFTKVCDRALLDAHDSSLPPACGCRPAPRGPCNPAWCAYTGGAWLEAAESASPAQCRGPAGLRCALLPSDRHRPWLEETSALHELRVAQRTMWRKVRSISLQCGVRSRTAIRSSRPRRGHTRGTPTQLQAPFWAG